MKQQLGNFRLLEQIAPGGYTTVYRAEEDMGLEFKRPAALKILHALDVDDEQKVAVLRRETELLIELGTCPNIVTIFGVGIDDEAGPWIAMELLGRSLKNFITDEPADPDQVRVMLRDALRALVVVHGTDPPILHRDLKPNNILSTDYGNWVIADFGLARRWGADETLHLATVQYAAPELLDTSIGSESPAMDLYSLGMAAYEFALGRTLYRKQFPSVYDPYGNKNEEGDLRPKWMYWHTSIQMALPPIGEVIEDYPTDLSELIASMTVKPLGERVDTAGKALAKLGRVEGTMAMAVEEPEVEPESALPKRWRTGALAALVVLLLMVTGIGYLWVRANAAPTVHLADEYVGTTPVMVTGVIDGFPSRGAASVELTNGSSFQVIVDDEGNFSSEVRTPDVGEYRAMLKIQDRYGRQVGMKSLVVERIPPETVQVVLATTPPVPRADVVITQHNTPDDPIRMQTGLDGVAHVNELPYGGFDVEIEHPRYVKLARSVEAGIEPKQEYDVRLDPIPLHEIYAEMRDLIQRIKLLASKKTICPPRPPLSETETEQFESSIERLEVLNEDDPDIDLFLDAVQRVRECDPESAKAMDEAAENAEKFVAEMEEALPEGERGPDSEPGSGTVVEGPGDPYPPGTNPTGTYPPGTNPTGTYPPGTNPTGTYPPGTYPTGGGGNGGGGDAGGRGGNVKDTIDDIIANAPPVDPVVVARLLAMSLDEFAQFVSENAPTGSLHIKPVEELNMVRLSGPVFDDMELERLILRLLPGLSRLQLELRVDAWAVCRRLERRLEDMSVEGVRVHAFLADGDHTMFVQFVERMDFDRDTAATIAKEHVIDEHIVRTKGFARFEDEDEEGSAAIDSTGS